MAITRFEDLPSENSPINSENLNGNFDELGVKVGTSVDNNYRTNIIKELNGNASIVVDGEEIYSKQKVEEAKINTAYNCYTRKIGNMVQLAVQFSNSSNPVNISGYRTISLGTVPNNCRPSAELICPCYVRHSSDGPNVVFFKVDTTGEVSLFNWGDALTGVENISSVITYIVN